MRVRVMNISRELGGNGEGGMRKRQGGVWGNTRVGNLRLSVAVKIQRKFCWVKECRVLTRECTGAY